MNDTEQDDGELEAVYADSVERESEAWQALRSFPPGSIGRARAWESWSRAISLTNLAWRRLNGDRAARPHAHA
jgi:hypothetical protein